MGALAVVLATASSFQFDGFTVLNGLVLTLFLRRGLRNVEVRLSYRKRLALRIKRARGQPARLALVMRGKKLALVLSCRAGRKTRLRLRAGVMKLSLTAS